MSNVLIIFQSNTEPLEQMALAVAVGAVEAGGSIRLRRLAAPGAPEVGHQSYGTIKAADLEWAETIVVGLEHEEPVAEELGPLLDVVQDKHFMEKRGWIFTMAGAGGNPTQAEMEVEAAMANAGITVQLPDSRGEDGLGSTDAMKWLGRAAGQSA